MQAGVPHADSPPPAARGPGRARCSDQVYADTSQRGTRTSPAPLRPRVSHLQDERLHLSLQPTHRPKGRKDRHPWLANPTSFLLCVYCCVFQIL